MEELYNYLSKADKVYLVERRKKVSMVAYTIRDNNVFVYIWKMQERDNATCYLAKFKNCWEIIVCKKGKEIELIKLKDKFELKNKFVCDGHQYSLYQEITYNLLDYLIHSC